jgi:hypothetical protein
VQHSRNTTHSCSKPKHTKRNLYQCHFVHHQKHMACRCKMILKNSVSTSQSTQFSSSIKSNRLVLYTKLVAPYFENHKKQILHEKCILFNTTAGGTYNYHRVLGTVTETLRIESNEAIATALEVSCSGTVKFPPCSQHILGPVLIVLRPSAPMSEQTCKQRHFSSLGRPKPAP